MGKRKNGKETKINGEKGGKGLLVLSRFFICFSKN